MRREQTDADLRQASLSSGSVQQTKSFLTFRLKDNSVRQFSFSLCLFFGLTCTKGWILTSVRILESRQDQSMAKSQFLPLAILVIFA